jgi:cysteinyl-tRNA synthetase
MDLVFPHHECEIAQAVASQGDEMVHYWMHNNMITINGQKMGRSLGNFITLEQFFTGNHEKLDEAYSPMTIRFFILQAHYRSTVDFSNEALKASRKGLERLMDAIKQLNNISATENGEIDKAYTASLRDKCYEAMNDDLNTPIVISHLFEACHIINQLTDKQTTITPDALEELKAIFQTFSFDILGLRQDADGNEEREVAYSKAIDLLLEIRQQAKANKDWSTSDRIRNELSALGFEVKDTRDGVTWKLNK